jgi:hypothetical protein
MKCARDRDPYGPRRRLRTKSRARSAQPMRPQQRSLESGPGSRCHVVEGPGPQRSVRPVGADDDAGGRSLRAGKRELAWRGSLRK